MTHAGGWLRALPAALTWLGAVALLVYAFWPDTVPELANPATTPSPSSAPFPVLSDLLAVLEPWKLLVIRPLAYGVVPLAVGLALLERRWRRPRLAVAGALVIASAAGVWLLISYAGPTERPDWAYRTIGLVTSRPSGAVVAVLTGVWIALPFGAIALGRRTAVVRVPGVAASLLLAAFLSFALALPLSMWIKYTSL